MSSILDLVSVTDSGAVDRFEEHAPSAPTIFKRRALAILTFVGFAIRPSRPAGTPAALGISDEGHTSTLIARLIQLASLEAQARDISDAANQTIQKVLKATSATVFVTASLVMLQSDHDKVRRPCCLSPALTYYRSNSVP